MSALRVAGFAALSVVVTVIGAEPAGLVLVVAAILWWRRQNRKHHPAIGDASLHPHLASLADLLAVGLRSGWSLADVLSSVGGLDNRVDRRVDAALRQFRQGRPLGEALESSFADTGAEGRRLAALVVSSQAGVAVGTDLTAWARELRTADRQAREAEARRLPVAMLAPLMLCVLPAFLLLTVVPLVVDGVRAVFETGAL